MFKNELGFRDFVASFLQKEGFNVQKEFRLPEGYRVDLLAVKDNVRSGIEVKLNKRGISDDISKGSILHKFPEFDHIYVAAPKMLISPEFIAYAKQLRIGIIGVKEDCIEWLLKSEKLRPAQLLGGSSLPKQVIAPGSIFEVLKNVKNHGEKVVRHLEMLFMPAGPFVTTSGEKSRFKRVKLLPGESWEVKFKIRVKKSAEIATYPLYLSCTADNSDRSDSLWDIEIVNNENERKIKMDGSS
jgi:hypothetical protein